MIKFLKRLFCRHPDGLNFVRNIYGDEIIQWGYKRSAWRCRRNGCLVGKDALHDHSALPAAESRDDTPHE